MKSVLIVGYGVVGRNFAKEISALHPDIYDKFKTEFNTKKDKKYDFAFICVDTPYVSEENPCDISQIINAIKENEAENYVIKSTILPGFLESIIEKFNFEKRIIVSPEFYGGTQHCNNFNFPFTILGGNKYVCHATQQLLQEVYDARHSFFVCDSYEAMLAKYSENCLLYAKVVTCMQIREICNAYNVDYDKVRELFGQDERIGKTHTYIYDEHPFVDSHCLNKDPKALVNRAKVNKADTSFFEAMLEFNARMRTNFEAKICEAEKAVPEIEEN